MAQIADRLLRGAAGGMMRAWCLAVLLALAWPSQGWAQAPERVVSLGGSVTEIVYALGEGERLVADDQSSLYPPAARRLPRVGYYRQVPLEGVAAMRPDLVLASGNAGPPQTLQRLSRLGLRVEVVSDEPGLDSLYTRVGEIARALDVPKAGERLLAEIRNELDAARSLPGTARRTAVLVNRGGQFMAAGGDTAAHAVLALAGLENVFAGQRGYRPISIEGLLMLGPTLIVTTTASLEASGGREALSAHPGIAGTPAGREGRVAVMDDLLILGMGPRVAQAVRQLREASR